MKDNAREFIINNLRNALLDANPVSTPTAGQNGSYFKMEHSDDPVLNFVKLYMLDGGIVNYCTSNSEIENLLNQWISSFHITEIQCGTTDLLQYLQNLNLKVDALSTIKSSTTCKFGVLLCDALVAWNGEIVISSDCFDEKNSVSIPENCVIVAFSSQIISDLKSYLSQKKNSDNLPQQIQLLNPKQLDHKKIQILLIEDQN